MQDTTFRSKFRELINPNQPNNRQRRSISEATPSTLLALELYIYLETYTGLQPAVICCIIYDIMDAVDWEMLAMLEEARDFRIPNVYEAEDDVEEEDMWVRIRFLPDHSISEGFESLLRRLEDMDFFVADIFHLQQG